jgi:hypothetical protein
MLSWRDIAQLHGAEPTRLETMPNYLLINHSSPRLPIYRFTSHAATAVGISITHTDEVIPNCTVVALSTPTNELKTTARHNVQCLIARPFRLASSQNRLHHPARSLASSLFCCYIWEPFDSIYFKAKPMQLAYTDSRSYGSGRLLADLAKFSEGCSRALYRNQLAHHFLRPMHGTRKYSEPHRLGPVSSAGWGRSSLKVPRICRH